MASQDEIQTLFKQAERLTRRARLQLYWERYAPALALGVLALFLFISGSFSGLWERIGDPWRLFALCLTVYFVARAFLKARPLRRPNTSDARRRVETESGIPHRPLDTLHDQAALSPALWDRHYARMTQRISDLRPTRMRPSLSPIDPYFLRWMAPAILVLSFMLGLGDNMERLRRAFTPAWQPALTAQNVQLEAWIDPPDYTGRPPLYLKKQSDITVPAGSELVARISGAQNVPRLKFITGDGGSLWAAKRLPLKRLGPKSFESRITLTQPSQLRWRIGTRQDHWVVTTVPDRPPTVTFDGSPKADKRDRLELAFSFEDDYGVEALDLHVQRLSDIQSDNELPAETQIIPVPLPSASVQEVENFATQIDLTKHKWAGKKVSGELVARDGLGQESRSLTTYFTIPDKIFVEPLAKTITEQRALLLEGQAPYAGYPQLSRRAISNLPDYDSYQPQFRLDRAPETIQRAALLIEAVTEYPENLFEDPTVFMGLKNVLYRLRYARQQEELADLPEYMWAIALRAEFGTLGTALEEMREAEQNLREAMARRAPQREIDTLFDRYNAAVDAYMEELRRKALEEGNVAEGQDGGGGDARNLDQIAELLKAIEEANRIGDVNGARRALAQLAELLENMQIQLALGQGSGSGDSPQGEMSEEMQKALEELADLLGEQRQLKDETEQAQNQEEQNGANSSPNGTPQTDGSQNGQGSGQSPLDAETLAEQQGALEEALRRLKESAEAAASGEDSEKEGAGSGDEGLDEALGRAGQAMTESERALGGEDLEGALEAQREAIEALRAAGGQLAELSDSRRNQGEAGDGEEANPLGENNRGANDDSFQADVDTKNDAARSRELLEELRRRAAEQEREQIEREYLERLLKRF